jgi:uncharacterized membrane protein
LNRSFVSENKIMGSILAWIAGFGVALMTSGMYLFLLKKGYSISMSDLSTFKFGGFRQTVAGLTALDPLLLMTMGIITFLFAPFIRVVGAIWIFAVKEKDSTYVWISCGVLLIMFSGFIIRQVLG